MGIELFERCLLAHRHIVNFVDCGRVFCNGRKDIRLNCFVDVTKVPARSSVPVDVDDVALEDRSGPFGNDRGIRSVWVLSRSKDIEVAQADRSEAIGTGKDVGVKLVRVFCYCIGTERFSYCVLHLRRSRVIAIHAAATRVREALYPSVARGHQHVQEARDVDCIGGERVGHTPWNAAKSGLMQDIVDPFAGSDTVVNVADIALNELKPRPLRRADEPSHLIKIMPVSGGKVVQAHHSLIEAKHRLQEIGADEPGDPGDQPFPGPCAQVSAHFLVASHFKNKNTQQFSLHVVNCIKTVPYAYTSTSRWARSAPFGRLARLWSPFGPARPQPCPNCLHLLMVSPIYQELAESWI